MQTPLLPSLDSVINVIKVCQSDIRVQKFSPKKVRSALCPLRYINRKHKLNENMFVS